MPKFGHLGSKFLKTNIGFEISTMNIWYQQNFVKIRKLIRFSPKCLNLGIWAQCLKNESRKKIPDFPNIETFGRQWLFRNFWVSLRLVAARFGWFRVVLARSGFLSATKNIENNTNSKLNNVLKLIYLQIKHPQSIFPGFLTLVLNLN